MRIFFASLAIATSIALPASAVTVAAYDTVNGASVAAAITAQDVTAADLTRGSGLREVGNANQFRSRRWGSRTSPANIETTNRFIEWGITSSVGWVLDDLSIAYTRNADGPTALSIFASYDGGAFTEVFNDASVDASVERNSINLGGVETSDVTFRLIAWGAVDNSGRLIIRTNQVGPGDDYGIVLSGSLAAVPVPASLPMLAGGLLLLGLTRRRA